MAELEPGTIFAGYRIERTIGRGGMGLVYEATEPALDRHVALKVISTDAASDPVFLDRFGHESRIAAQVEHPNVIPVYAVGEEGGTPYLVMRFVSGLDLGGRIKALRRLEPEDAAALISQVAAGLDAIHAAGLIHRDVKPANILLAGEEGREHAYITDFGLAKHIASSSEQTSGGVVMGTLDYVSPEQIEHRPLDARADVYSLGAVLYKTLTGSVPFPHRDVAAKVWGHVNEEPPLPSATAGVPPSFDEVIARAMAKRPEDRYPSAGDLGRAAVAAASGDPIVEPERRVARGDALTPSLMMENEEGPTGELARRYSEVEPTAVLADGGERASAGEVLPAGTAPQPRRRRRRIPPALVAAVIGAAVGGAVFLLERQSTSGPAELSPKARQLIGRADEICAESRGEFNLIVEGLPAKLPPEKLPTEAPALGQLIKLGHDSMRELRRIDPPPELAEKWKRYLKLRAQSVDQLIEARDAAVRSDGAAYQAAFEKINSPELQLKRHDLAQAIGLRGCSRNEPPPKRNN